MNVKYFLKIVTKLLRKIAKTARDFATKVQFGCNITVIKGVFNPKMTVFRQIFSRKR